MFPSNKLRLALFPVRAAVLSALFLSFAIGAIYYFLYISAARENQINQQNALHLARTAISSIERESSNWAKDYAWWDATLENATGNVDIEWAENNIGTYLQDTFGISGSFVVNGKSSTIFFSPRTGQIESDALAFLGEGGEEFLTAVQNTDMAESIALTTYVNRFGRTFLVAAAPITPEIPTEQDLIRRPRSILILLKELDKAVIEKISSQFLLTDLVLLSDLVLGSDGSQLDGDLLDLNSIDGTPRAYLRWKSNRSGDTLISELLPRISLVIGSLFVIAMFMLFGWWHMASTVSAARSSFLAKMSHELRTPLNPIVGFSEIMSKEILGPIPDNYRSYAQDIHLSSKHLSSLIEDVLDISCIEVGQMILHEKEINLRQLLLSLPPVSHQLTARSAPEAKSSSVTVVEVIDDDLPNIIADELRVRQVLLNLLSNATKFSEGNHVILKATLKDGQVTISVKDRGVGISKSDLARIFTPFVQIGKPAQDNQPHGTGLGLVVSKEVMALHGGSLEIMSKLGEGTTVIMTFPPYRTVV